MLPKRRIIETFIDEQDAPLANRTVLFYLDGRTGDDGRIVLSRPIRGRTNSSGVLYDPKASPDGLIPGIELLCAADAAIPKTYLAKLPMGDTKPFALTFGDGTAIRLFTLLDGDV